MNVIAAPLQVFDFNRREVISFITAVGIHSLLLLWTAGLIQLPEKKLGEEIVAVNFQVDGGMGGRAAQAGGGGTDGNENIISKMKSFFTAPPKAAGTPKSALAQSREAHKIETKDLAWNKMESPKLEGKEFNQSKGFTNAQKKDGLALQQGKNSNQQLVSAKGSFEDPLSSAPKLKSKDFKMSNNDVAFKTTKPGNADELQNVNAIPVQMAKATSPNVKALAGGGPSGGASKLQGKTFAGGNSGGGFGSPSGTSSNGGGLVTGGGSKIGGSLISGGSDGTSVGGGSSGGGSPSGTKSGRSGGGSGAAGFGGMTSLPRNTVGSGGGSGGGVGTGTGKGQGPFWIEGDLAGRGIITKVIPKIYDDIRAAFRFKVDWKGRVLHGIEIVLSSGNPVIDNKIVDALMQWVFVQLPANRANEIQQGVITFRFKGI